ncbi:hypothetical protein EG028_14950 [Chitinophaga barathri]|uniref:Uncharacterized protein n=1 Tax=Chitinophaga barathri TaxID=1647451 RepID=A0A3N4MA14_9BACT|nr:hypothetical protein EG028_14950 [Chitinophaga barathri]
MTRVAIFFICLFALLLGRDAYVYAGTHPYHHNCSRYTLAQKTDNTRHVKIPDTHKYRARFVETEVEKGTGFLVTEKVEDDDTSTSFSRKYKLLARFYLVFSAVFLAGCLHNRIKTAPVFIGILSNKYIVQRVLRI